MNSNSTRLRHKKRSKADAAPIRLQLQILRRASAESTPYWQKIDFETTERNATVAYALTALNDGDNARDINGDKISFIQWECSCLQKKCGACAMVIDGVPRLACDAYLRDYKKTIRIEPLRKFPVIADLIVDRSILMENLKVMQLWSQEGVEIAKKQQELAYEASRCLQCGCCLEVCPNFSVENAFFGAAAFVPTTRLLRNLSGEEQASLKAQYLRHVYAGCGKSLSCKTVCPAGIDTEEMLVQSNAVRFSRSRSSMRK